MPVTSMVGVCRSLDAANAVGFAASEPVVDELLQAIPRPCDMQTLLELGSARLMSYENLPHHRRWCRRSHIDVCVVQSAGRRRVHPSLLHGFPFRAETLLLCCPSGCIQSTPLIRCILLPRRTSSDKRADIWGRTAVPCGHR